MKNKKNLALTLALLLGTLAASQAADNLKAFPPAPEGMTRHVLQLPPKEDESLCRVELIVGKTVATDPVNRYFFAGKIEAQNVKGWGFTKYVVKELGPLAGTMMASRPGSEKVERFVALGGGPYLIRYNSKVPVVLYTPDDAQTRYRLWCTSPKAKPFPD